MGRVLQVLPNPLARAHLVRKSSAARRALSICSRMLALSTVAVRICGERDQVTAWGTLSPDWGSETGLPTPAGGGAGCGCLLQEAALPIQPHPLMPWS